MPTTKYTATFILDKRDNNPYHHIRYRIKWNGLSVAFKIGYEVDIEKWSKEVKRCKNNTTHGKRHTSASVVNRELNRYEDIVNEVFASYERKSETPTANDVRYEVNKALGKDVDKPNSEKTLFELFDEFLLMMGSRNTWAKATYERLRNVKNHLYAFDSKLSLRTLNEAKMIEFVKHLHSINLRNITISKNITFIRWFLRWCYQHDYYNGKLHDTFRPKLKGTDGKSKEVIHLTKDEVISLHNLKFPKGKEHLERVRDVFLFLCFTGLRYSDVANLKKSNIKDTYIDVITQKTVDGLRIELNNYSKAIIDKYAALEFPKDLALPVTSNQRMNGYLKDIGRMAGIDTPQRIVYFKGMERIEEVYPKHELISTHCGRRTFVVNALYLGIAAETIMKWTGHSDFHAMKPYMKIVDELKEREMAKFNLFESPN